MGCSFLDVRLAVSHNNRLLNSNQSLSGYKFNTKVILFHFREEIFLDALASQKWDDYL